MRQNLSILLAICILFLTAVHAKDESSSPSAEISSKSHHPEQTSAESPQSITVQSEKEHARNKKAVKGYPDVHKYDQKQTNIQHSDQQNVEIHQDDIQHSEAEHFEKQHTQEPQPEARPGHDKYTKPQLPTGRQFLPPPYHQHMLFQPPTGFEAIRRQLSGGIGSDLVMMGLISLPILGLLTMGSASLGNLFGLGSSSSSSKKSSSKRNKRSLKEKAADAVEYAKNLWNVMEQLETAFEKYDLYQAECRLRVVCEAHHKDRRMGSWGQNILDLMRQQKELEGRELLPVSRFLFSNYAEAAQAGARNENCAQLYTGCPRHLSYYLSAKEDQLENEVENGM